MVTLTSGVSPPEVHRQKGLSAANWFGCLSSHLGGWFTAVGCAEQLAMARFPLSGTKLEAACHVATQIATFGSVTAQRSAFEIDPLQILDLAQPEMLPRVSVGVGVIPFGFISIE
jgi:hypothetical protein